MDGATGALENVRGFSAILAKLKAEYPSNTLVLSSGDNYIPGPRYAAAAEEAMRGVLYVGVPGQGRADIAWVNLMGIQATCVGNHDLDSGTGAFADILEPQMEGDDYYPGAMFPYLSTNLDFTTDANLAGLVATDGRDATTIPNTLSGSCKIMVNGEWIGVVGASTPSLGSITSTGDITITPSGSWTNAQLAAAIQPAVDALTAQGIDKIILLAHMQTISVEKELATLLEDVDIIVAGGSNTLLADATDRLRTGDVAADDYPLERTSASGDPVLIVNTDGDYKYVGRLVVTFEDGVIDTGSVNPAVSGAYATDQYAVITSGATVDPAVDDVADALEVILFAQEGNVFGNTTVYIDGRRSQVRSQETNMGNLSADANLWYARRYDATVEISIKNGGGIRDDIGYFTYPPGSTDLEDLEFFPPAAVPAAGKGEGDVSEFDIKGTLRFNNSLTLVDISAANLYGLLQWTVSGRWNDPVDGPAEAGRFPQVGNLRFSFDPNGTPSEPTYDPVSGDQTGYTTGTMLRNLVVLNDDGTIRDTVVVDGVLQGDPNRTFRLVILGYLADGGDDYFVPAAGMDRIDIDGDSSQDPGSASFATSGTEQDALAEYLAEMYPDSDTPFTAAETDADLDERIQDVTKRTDTVLTP
jgi:5'-nucleotidase/UDP-sugar diphosphatase